MTNEFTMDNTQGYTPAQLDELNRRFEVLFGRYSTADQSEKAVRDHVAEHVLAEFDISQ